MTDLHIRRAEPADLDALIALEHRCFDGDRLSRRSFRRLLGRDTAAYLIAETEGAPAGYALLLFRRETALARLYSIAVDPERRGTGVGAALLGAAETAAFERDRIYLRLEVRADNHAAIALYRRLGYGRIGRYPDYYDDHTDALRFEKRLIAGEHRPGRPTPYIPQTTEFTCGAACMMMALARFDPALAADRRLEFRLWREATTIFMTSGHGGCDPVGMAVALKRHGLRATVVVSQPGPLFLESVRSPGKREVMLVTQQDFRDEADRLGIPVAVEPVTRARLTATVDAGGVAIVLISSYRMFRERIPHWILVHAHDDRHLYVHDPWIDDADFETPVSAANLPIPFAEFDRMARYGRDRLRAAVLVTGRERDA